MARKRVKNGLLVRATLGLVMFGIIQLGVLYFAHVYKQPDLVDKFNPGLMVIMLFAVGLFRPLKFLWKFLGRPLLIFLFLAPLILQGFKMGINYFNIELSPFIARSLYYSSLGLAGTIATVLTLSFNYLLETLAYYLFVVPFKIITYPFRKLWGLLFPTKPLCSHLKYIDNLGKGLSKYHRGLMFEEYVCEVYKRLGYKAYTTTQLREMGKLPPSIQARGGAGEQGVDVLVYGSHGEVIAIQVKHYSKNVPNSAVQEINTALPLYGANRGVVVSNQNFTSSAIELAHHNGIQLIGRNELPDLVEKSNRISLKRENLEQQAVA